MTAYKEDYEKAQEIVDEMGYAGVWWVEREEYDATLVLPWMRIELK